MEVDYYSKYLKYKTKYLDLQRTLIGGTDFDTVYDDIKLTDAHMDELNVKTDTAQALKEAMRLLKEGKVPLGVKNREKQPNWYKDNPTFFTISKNTKLLKEFYDKLNSFKLVSTSDEVQKGGLGYHSYSARNYGSNTTSTYVLTQYAKNHYGIN
jgi:hypothetical protein